jgi:DNA-binding FadR family transcriptional regulator
MRDLCMVSVELIVRLTFEKVDSVSASIENHFGLLDAIRSRKPDQAKKASERVLCKTVEDLLNLNIPFGQDILNHFEGKEGQ